MGLLNFDPWIFASGAPRCMVLLQSKRSIRKLRIGGLTYETNTGASRGLCLVYRCRTTWCPPFNRNVYGIKDGIRQGPEIRVDQSARPRLRRDQGRKRRHRRLGRGVDEPESSSFLWLDGKDGTGRRYRLCDRGVCEEWRPRHD